MPSWLADITPDTPTQFLVRAFFQSRVVYYPGSGFDGNMVRLFNSTHSAHCFIYCDYGESREKVVDALDGCQGRPFRGYTTLRRVELTPADLTPRGYKPSLPPPWPKAGSSSWLPLIGHWLTVNDFPIRPRIRPFAFMEILERDPMLDDSHGANRLAILFLGADAYAAYDALFSPGNAGYSPPFTVIIQDRGFGFGGGNYDRFGEGGWLERVAMTYARHPAYLLVDTGSKPWAPYVKVPESAFGFYLMYRHCQLKVLGATPAPHNRG